MTNPELLGFNQLYPIAFEKLIQSVSSITRAWYYKSSFVHNLRTFCGFWVKELLT